jgi:DNA polymerase
MVNGWFEIVLPSGRKLRYMKPTILQNDYGPALTYMSPRGFAKSLYGGLLVENITQAVARDVFAEGKVAAEHIATVVIDVHDELVCESDHNVVHELEATLNVAPAWLPNLPMKIEFFESEAYSKSPVYLGGK